MRTEKIISKFQNYWYNNVSLREEIYFCMDKYYLSKQDSLYLHNDKFIEFRKKYSDLYISPNELSTFLSGLLFDKLSLFYDRDSYKKPSKGETLKDKNTKFSNLGKKLGDNCKLFNLLYLSYRNELTNSNLKNLSTKFSWIIEDTSNRKILGHLNNCGIFKLMT